MADWNSPEGMLESVNCSGFPLQIAVSNLVNHLPKTSPLSGKWHVLYEEHAWHDAETGKGGFIDLVLSHEMSKKILVVECKRMRDNNWIFLGHEENQTSRTSAKTLIYNYENNIFCWKNMAHEANSPLCKYSVINAEKDVKRINIDQIASETILSTQSFAEEYAEEQVYDSCSGAQIFFCSLIVTTAKLYLCDIDPNEIALSNGEIPSGVEPKPIPFVRYHKQLATMIKPEYHNQEERLDKAKERTVFIVNVDGLQAFLERFAYGD